MSNLQTVPQSARYGLVKKQGELSGPALAKQQQQQGRFGLSLSNSRGISRGPARAPPRGAASSLGGAFSRGGDSDEDLEEGDGNTVHSGQRAGAPTSEIGNVNRDIMRASRITESKQLDATYSADDAAAFDYDGQYDSFKKESHAALGAHALNQPNTAPVLKSRYVNGLKAVAAVREKEKDRIYERKLLRERLEDEKTLGIDDTPKFITSAYKKKLQEEQKWDYEDKLNDEVERRNDVTTKGQGMAGFYTGLLTKNIAMGGDVSAAVSAYTSGSARQAMYMGNDPDTIDTPAVAAPTIGKEDGDELGNGGGNKRRLASQDPDDDVSPTANHKNPTAMDPPPSQAHPLVNVNTGLAEQLSGAEQKTLDAERKAEAVAAAKLRFLERKKQKISS